MVNSQQNKYLKDIYFNPKNPASFSGLDKVWKIIRGDKVVTRSELKDWLLEQDIYTSFRPVNRKIKRPKTISIERDFIWGSDVAYMQRFEKNNKGFGYFVVFIDLFTRYAWVYPLKTLRGVEMVQTLKKVFAIEKCKTLFTDSGTEYLNRSVSTYLKSIDVKHYNSKTDKKVAHAERLIKQLKRKIFQYMDEKNTYTWTSVLPDVVSAYNKSVHRIIKMTPTEARTADQYTLWSNQYFTKPKITKKISKPKTTNAYKFQEGDRVKLLAEKKPFDREYDQRYTTEVFTITARHTRGSIPFYIIKDELNDPIIGRFYEQELLKVNVPNDKVYKIEKIISKRTRNGRKEILVKWRGWPKKFNSYVSEIEYLNPEDQD